MITRSINIAFVQDKKYSSSVMFTSLVSDNRQSIPNFKN